MRKGGVWRTRSPLTDCWTFTDGTVRPILWPLVNHSIIGHKHSHVITFRSTMAPNGIIRSFGWSSTLAGRKTQEQMETTMGGVLLVAAGLDTKPDKPKVALLSHIAKKLTTDTCV